MRADSRRKKSYKMLGWGISIAAALLLVIVFVIGYLRINRRFPEAELVEIHTGESIVVSGYKFTMRGMEMGDGTRANEIAENSILALNDDGSVYEEERVRVIFAHVQVEKVSNTDEVLNFTAINAESGAWRNGMNIVLYKALNPEISPVEFAPEKGTVTEVILPYMMVDTMFKKKDWEKIDEREFKVILSLYPQKIMLME